MIEVTYSINRYDSDGDLDTKGIYLHFGEVSIRVADSVEDYKKWADELTKMYDQIQEDFEANYSDR